MKIWKEFNSSHSSNISIVGTFNTDDKANAAFTMIEDFALSSWEERYPSLKAFTDYWAANFHADLPYIGLTEDEIESGIDNEPDIEREGDTIKISRFRSNNIGGIVKLLRFAGAGKIVIE
ncbi:MAG TPA: DUF6375 family protein [Flavihumibacter sp.]|nr:DUF6375 family protein [Flavihumibacter sp.]